MHGEAFWGKGTAGRARKNTPRGDPIELKRDWRTPVEDFQQGLELQALTHSHIYIYHLWGGAVSPKEVGVAVFESLVGTGKNEWLEPFHLRIGLREHLWEKHFSLKL